MALKIDNLYALVFGWAKVFEENGLAAKSKAHDWLAKLDSEDISSIDILYYISECDKVWNGKLIANANISSTLACHLENWKLGSRQTYVNTKVQDISLNEINLQASTIKTSDNSRIFYFAIAVLSCLDLQKLSNLDIQAPVTVKSTYDKTSQLSVVDSRNQTFGFLLEPPQNDGRLLSITRLIESLELRAKYSDIEFAEMEPLDSPKVIRQDELLFVPAFLIFYGPLSNVVDSMSILIESLEGDTSCYCNSSLFTNSLSLCQMGKKRSSSLETCDLEQSDHFAKKSSEDCQPEVKRQRLKQKNHSENSVTPEIRDDTDQNGEIVILDGNSIEDSNARKSCLLQLMVDKFNKAEDYYSPRSAMTSPGYGEFIFLFSFICQNEGIEVKHLVSQDIELLLNKPDDQLSDQDLFAITGMLFCRSDVGWLREECYTNFLNSKQRNLSSFPRKDSPEMQNKSELKSLLLLQCDALKRIQECRENAYELLAVIDSVLVSCWLRKCDHWNEIAEMALVLITAVTEGCFSKTDRSKLIQHSCYALLHLIAALTGYGLWPDRLREEHSLVHFVLDLAEKLKHMLQKKKHGECHLELLYLKKLCGAPSDNHELTIEAHFKQSYQKAHAAFLVLSLIGQQLPCQLENSNHVHPVFPFIKQVPRVLFLVLGQSTKAMKDLVFQELERLTCDPEENSNSNWEITNEDITSQLFAFADERVKSLLHRKSSLIQGESFLRKKKQKEEVMGHTDFEEYERLAPSRTISSDFYTVHVSFDDDPKGMKKDFYISPGRQVRIFLKPQRFYCFHKSVFHGSLPNQGRVSVDFRLIIESSK